MTQQLVEATAVIKECYPLANNLTEVPFPHGEVSRLINWIHYQICLWDETISKKRIRNWISRDTGSIDIPSNMSLAFTHFYYRQKEKSQ